MKINLKAVVLSLAFWRYFLTLENKAGGQSKILALPVIQLFQLSHFLGQHKARLSFTFWSMPVMERPDLFRPRMPPLIRFS